MGAASEVVQGHSDAQSQLLVPGFEGLPKGSALIPLSIYKGSALFVSMNHPERGVNLG